MRGLPPTLERGPVEQNLISLAFLVNGGELIMLAVQDVAEGRLRSNSYLALRNINCDYHDGILTLHGCLPTYHLKQIAQVAVSLLPGVARIDNRIEVISAR